MNKNNPAKGVVWDLTPLYKGIDDPQIEKDVEKVLREAKAFTKKYKGKINTPDITPKEYKKILDENVEMDELLLKLDIYATLLKEKNSLDEEISALGHKISDVGSKYSATLAWVSVERKGWSNSKATEMANAPELGKFKHFHEHERTLLPFTLSEKEEALLSRLSLIGTSSLVKLYGRLKDNLKYKLKVDGEERELSLPEVAEIASKHEDRNTRQRAHEVSANKIIKYEVTNALILNSLLTSSKISDEVRGYDYPAQDSYLSNETPEKLVEPMIREAQKGYKLSERYFSAKRKALGYEKMFSWDRSIPVYREVDKRYSWEEAKSLVLDAFNDFDEEFGALAQAFFDNNWIDAEISDNKAAGAFCMSGTPTSNPYILMNFTGIIDDVFTLAHELGHGVPSLLGKDKSLYEFWASTATAEIASVFAESLVFDHMFGSMKDKKEKTNVLGRKIEDSIGTVFIQTAFHLFEQDVHKHIREKGEIKISDFNNYFISRYQDVYGKSVYFSKEFASRWAYIHHFFHFSFYVYTYAFGELLTIALYSNYKEGKNGFVARYKEGLAMRGSASPEEITKTMGVDINTPGFWKSGLDVLESYVKEYEELIG